MFIESRIFGSAIIVKRARAGPGPFGISEVYAWWMEPFTVAVSGVVGSIYSELLALARVNARKQERRRASLAWQRPCANLLLKNLRAMNIQ